MARTIIAALAAGLLLAGAAGPGSARADETPSTADPGAKNITQTQGTVMETPKGSTEKPDANKNIGGSGTGALPPGGNSGETKK